MLLQNLQTTYWRVFWNNYSVYIWGIVYFSRWLSPWYDLRGWLGVKNPCKVVLWLPRLYIYEQCQISTPACLSTFPNRVIVHRQLFCWRLKWKPLNTRKWTLCWQCQISTPASLSTFPSGLSYTINCFAGDWSESLVENKEVGTVLTKSSRWKQWHGGAKGSLWYSQWRARFVPLSD